MDDQDRSLYFEVVYCFHPTEYDTIGRDGLYVKSVAKIEDPATLRARVAELEAEHERVEALEKKWRKGGHFEMNGLPVYNGAYKLCADELAAALKKAG